jgi:hypothetical protein
MTSASDARAKVANAVAACAERAEEGAQPGSGWGAETVAAYAAAAKDLADAYVRLMGKAG